MAELFGGEPPPRSPQSRRRWVLTPPIGHLNADVGPRIGSRSFTITADIEAVRPSGMLYAVGSCHSGMALYVKDERLVFDYNAFGHHSHVVSDARVPAGRSQVGVRFTRVDRDGRAELTIAGEPVGAVPVPVVLRIFSTYGTDIGRHVGAPVCADYEAPFAFEGTIHRIVVEAPRRVRAHEVEAQQAEGHAEMARE